MKVVLLQAADHLSRAGPPIVGPSFVGRREPMFLTSLLLCRKGNHGSWLLQRWRTVVSVGHRLIGSAAGCRFPVAVTEAPTELPSLEPGIQVKKRLARCEKQGTVVGQHIFHRCDNPALQDRAEVDQYVPQKDHVEHVPAELERLITRGSHDETRSAPATPDRARIDRRGAREMPLQTTLRHPRHRSGSEKTGLRLRQGLPRRHPLPGCSIASRRRPR